MGRVRVRYRNGDVDEWELHEQGAGAENIARALFDGMSSKQIIGFGVVSREGTSISDYGMAGIRMTDVVSIEIDGLVDLPSDAALWQEADPSR